MEKPFGACLIITSLKNITVHVLPRTHVEYWEKVSIMSAIEYADAVHNFLLSQKLTSYPEVLQVNDIIEHNGACNGQSVIVHLVFLSAQLLVERNMSNIVTGRSAQSVLPFSNGQSYSFTLLEVITYGNADEQMRQDIDDYILKAWPSSI